MWTLWRPGIPGMGPLDILGPLLGPVAPTLQKLHELLGKAEGGFLGHNKKQRLEAAWRAGQQ